MFQATHPKTKKEVKIKNGSPHFTLTNLIDGDIREKSDENFAITKESIKKIEKKLEEDGTKGFKALIKQTQEDDSDIFGFGEYVRAHQPAYWNREIKTKKKWQEMYKDVS